LRLWAATLKSSYQSRLLHQASRFFAGAIVLSLYWHLGYSITEFIDAIKGNGWFSQRVRTSNLDVRTLHKPQGQEVDVAIAYFELNRFATFSELSEELTDDNDSPLEMEELFIPSTNDT
jgi:hypothetical protein